ncbi:cupin domain-containing protein [Asticcacaulis sp. BYS171W]|uniref:Cupin domain-containing protein n=1 Tax=Asticcacaulis aquaticus TaxID=2984212 RepID=A0ABT5HQP1_9CAUL|nr:cupin domain-containing protein [Asticcacaulis aquaticus]MDC7682391.1 cupin domain-containing protein [Asticcacaulis aquaticus]
MTADAIITRLNLRPHPEGGHYAETFRDADDGRAASSAIYYLLKAGERSHWHRIDAVEVWHYYAGAPLRLSLHHGGRGEDIILGPDILNGQRPQGVVPVGGWQAAESLGDWTLVGCTVAPAFEFAGFEMAPDGWAPE